MNQLSKDDTHKNNHRLDYVVQQLANHQLKSVNLSIDYKFIRQIYADKNTYDRLIIMSLLQKQLNNNSSMADLDNFCEDVFIQCLDVTNDKNLDNSFNQFYQGKLDDFKTFVHKRKQALQLENFNQPQVVLKAYNDIYQHVAEDYTLDRLLINCFRIYIKKIAQQRQFCNTLKNLFTWFIKGDQLFTNLDNIDSTLLECDNELQKISDLMRIKIFQYKITNRDNQPPNISLIIYNTSTEQGLNKITIINYNNQFYQLYDETLIIESQQVQQIDYGINTYSNKEPKKINNNDNIDKMDILNEGGTDRQTIVHKFNNNSYNEDVSNSQTSRIPSNQLQSQSESGYQKYSNYNQHNRFSNSNSYQQRNGMGTQSDSLINQNGFNSFSPNNNSKIYLRDNRPPFLGNEIQYEMLSCNKCNRKEDYQEIAFINNCQHYLCQSCLISLPDKNCPLKHRYPSEIQKSDIAPILGQDCAINLQIQCPTCKSLFFHQDNFFKRSVILTCPSTKCQEICLKHMDVLDQCFCYCDSCQVPTTNLHDQNLKICLFCQLKKCDFPRCASQKLTNETCRCRCIYCYEPVTDGGSVCLGCTNICSICNYDKPLKRLMQCSKCERMVCYSCSEDPGSDLVSSSEIQVEFQCKYCQF